MTMAISVFHYPFYDKLSGLLQTGFRLLPLADALRFRPGLDLFRPDRSPFLCLPEQFLSLLRRFGTHLLYKRLSGLLRVSYDLPRLRLRSGLVRLDVLFRFCNLFDRL